MPTRQPLFLATVLLSLSCGKPFWNPPPPPAEPVTPPPASADAITSIYLTRSACLGTCPHYHLLLRATGTATYVGVTDTTRLGTYQSSLPPETFRTLAANLLRNGFFEHPNSLATPLDAPITHVVVTVQDPTFRQKSAAGAQPDSHYLWPLAATLDSLGATLPWRFQSRDTIPPVLPSDAV